MQIRKCARMVQCGPSSHVQTPGSHFAPMSTLVTHFTNATAAGKTATNRPKTCHESCKSCERDSSKKEKIRGMMINTRSAGQAWGGGRCCGQ